MLLRERPADVDKWAGPYSQRPIPLDPWGFEYHYEHPGQEGDDSYLLYSLGKDGVEGGDPESEDEDIIESGE